MRLSSRKKFPNTAPLLCWDVFMLQNYAVTDLLERDVQQLELLAQERSWQHSWNFREKIIERKKTIVVTNLLQRIEYASSSLTEMTGYLPEEVIGRQPKLFQGENTSADTRALIRSAIEQQQSFSTSLINYKKNGASYTCHIEGFPVHNLQGDLVNYIAFEHNG